MKKNMVYFVLYIVLISELLIVITERDELEAKDHLIRQKMLSTIAESFKRPLVLTVPQKKSDYNIGSEDPIKVVLTPAGLTSSIEKTHIEYYVDLDEKSSKVPPDWPEGGITLGDSTKNFKIIRDNGNAIFMSRFNTEGEYKFKAYCELKRQLPDYLPDFLLDSLKSLIGGNINAQSNLEEFVVNSKFVGSVKKKRAEVSF